MPNINHQEISISSLVPFSNHPFKLYSGKRFEDMVNSVSENGIIQPIVVRRLGYDKYEILSGHNRVEAAKAAELIFVPAIVRENLSDEDALLIVTETNLIQRSFADLKHSERALAFATHYKAMESKQGYRADLLSEIGELTSSPVGTKLRGGRKVGRLGEQFDLSANTISRYLHINNLTGALKDRVDTNNLPLRTAVSLSYLRENEQEAVDAMFSEFTVSMATAERLRVESAARELSETDIRGILSDANTPTKVNPVKLSGKFLASCSFTKDQSQEEVESIIKEAMEFWRKTRQ